MYLVLKIHRLINTINAIFITFISILVLYPAGSFCQLDVQTIPVDAFTPSSECGKCHQSAYKEWRGSIHYFSHYDPIYQNELAQAKASAGSDISHKCSICHTPLAALADLSIYSDESKLPREARYGIVCDFCHTITGKSHDAGYSYRINPGNMKFGPFDDAITDAHGTEYSEFTSSPEFCAICHDTGHLVDGMSGSGTYSEWKESFYNTGNVETSTTCQNCHMTPGLNKFEPYPGSAAQDAPQRKHVSTHSFTAANTSIPGKIGTPSHNLLAVESLRSAAEVNVIGPANAKSGAEYVFWVTITNSGAGHYLPTGLPGIRQMWLFISVIDKKTGQSLFKSGEVDGSGHLDPDSFIIGARYADNSGKPTYKTWEAVSIISDNRIGPGETVKRKYKFRIPVVFKGNIAIFAVLKYRSAPQEFTDRVLGKDFRKLAIIEAANYIYGDIAVR